MQALQRHRYAEAADQFHRLLTAFPSERALADRSRVYLELCEREMRRHVPAPTTIEERLTAATAALNDANEDSAERLARSVLEDAPKHELALYLLAAVEARRGGTDAALGWLGRAIAASPEIRAQARHDADFEILRGTDRFRQLIELPAGFSASRRPRRARPER